MAWIVLILSGVLESVWAIALGKSEGFTRMTPVIIFLVAMALSMAGLGYAMRSIPIGTSYAIWTGIGAALTVIYGMVTGSEPVSILKVVFLSGLIICIIGLKLVHA